MFGLSETQCTLSIKCEKKIFKKSHLLSVDFAFKSKLYMWLLPGKWSLQSWFVGNIRQTSIVSLFPRYITMMVRWEEERTETRRGEEEGTGREQQSRGENSPHPAHSGTQSPVCTVTHTKTQSSVHADAHTSIHNTKTSTLGLLIVGLYIWIINTLTYLLVRKIKDT